jgi:flagella basal body P-ring formation protein FlgA
LLSKSRLIRSSSARSVSAETARGGRLATYSAACVPARRPKSEAAPNVIREPEQAVGMVAKRALRAGQAIRQSDFAKQELVARNEAVTISYEVPGINVSIRGQALEPGAQGDLINVLNVQSKKTLQATVTGRGRVSVGNTPASSRVATLPSNKTR